MEKLILTEKKQKSHRKGVKYGDKDFIELMNLLNDPVLRDAIPKNIRNKRNKSVLWCIKEFTNILNNRMTAHQASLNFSSGEIEDLHREVIHLHGITNKLTKLFERATTKKDRWWKF